MSLNQEFLRRLDRLGIRIPKPMLPRATTDLSKWSVVACDQYTSDHDYWNSVTTLVGDAPSTLRLTLPEIYLDTPDVSARIDAIHETMSRYLRESVLSDREETLIYVERRTEASGLRQGLVLAFDLEKYDYAKDSKSMIRATEGTIVERIPPRLAVRRTAQLEIPHIMILIEDMDRKLIEGLESRKQEFEKVYDCELMMNGGHLSGYAISSPEHIDAILNDFEALLERSVRDQNTDEPLFFAMGDGNHSLATAKALWEEIKLREAKTGKSADAIMDHPARFALAELVNIHSPGLRFEPIHRVLFTKKVAEFVKFMQADPSVASIKPIAEAELKALLQGPAGQHMAGIFDGKQYYRVNLSPALSKLPPAIIDEVLADFKSKDPAAKVDYIHGWQDVVQLATGEAISLLVPVIARERLFSQVQDHGPLPRKAFSMGEAEEKRYYMEARSII